MKSSRPFATTLVIRDTKFSQHCLTLGFILTFVVKTLQTTKFGTWQQNDLGNPGLKNTIFLNVTDVGGLSKSLFIDYWLCSIIDGTF